MSSLNEACGDRRFINLTSRNILESVEEERLLSFPNEKLQQLKEQKSVEIGTTYAQMEAARYQDFSCICFLTRFYCTPLLHT